MKIKHLAIVVGLAIFATSCGGGDESAQPVPTPTAAPMTLTGSPLDNVGNAPTAVPVIAPEPSSVDCEVHAESPEDCVDHDHLLDDGPGANLAIGFDDSLWSYDAEYPVWTNVEDPYPIEEVVETTVRVARAELAGQDQGFFPHLAGRRDAPPYVRVGVYSVTVLFAADPENEPARVVVAVAGETSSGLVVDELVSYHWQWTPERWIPEWEYLLAPTPDPSALGDSDDGDTGQGTDSDTTPAPVVETPESPGAMLCPLGFPYAHKNGKCYANPINPNDQLYPVTTAPPATYEPPPPGAPNALDVLPAPTPTQ